MRSLTRPPSSSPGSPSRSTTGPNRWPERPHGVDPDRLLTNVSVYWFTRTGPSAAHALYENAHSHEWIPAGGAPQGWAVFGADPLVRQLMDPERKIEHWSEYDRGGHFPALEVPDLLVDDLRSFLRGRS